MKLNYAFIAETVSIGQNGKYSLIDVYDIVYGEKLPLTRNPFNVCVSVLGKSGEYNEKVEIINLKDGSIVARAEEKIEIKNEGRNLFVASFRPIAFPNYGKYWIKVTIDGMEEPLTSPDIHYVLVKENL